MPNNTFEAAAREAYATALSDDPDLDTLEIYHPDGNGGIPFYLVADRVGHELKLETGDVKTFEAAAFRFQMPPIGPTGKQQLQLSIDNTDKRIGLFLDSVEGSATAVRVTYRPYKASDPDTCLTDPPFTSELKDVVVTKPEASGNCEIMDVINRKWPTQFYNRRRFRGLANL